MQQTAAEVNAETKQTKPRADKRGRHLWTDDEKREAIRMYSDGEDLETIAKKFDSTKLSVQKIANAAGVRRPWPTRGMPSAINPTKPAPVPSAADIEAEDKQCKQELRDYRKQYPKPYYLN